MGIKPLRRGGLALGSSGLARVGLAIADARAADDVELRRIVAVDGLDAAPHALDLVPNVLAERFALVVGLGRFGFDAVDLGGVLRDLGQDGFERLGGQVADLEGRVDFAPGFQNALPLLDNIMWISLSTHGTILLSTQMFSEWKTNIIFTEMPVVFNSLTIL